MPHKPPGSLPETGAYSALVGTALFFVLGGWILVGGPLTGLATLDVLLLDTHYKYLALLLIPTTAYFVIAHWVGWQYYRNS